MTLPGAASLQIEADLALVVTAPDGRSTTARATGEGSDLTVETPRPDILLAAVDRGDIGPLADVLDAAGVSVHLNGPGGRVATIGAAASSRFGRVVTGSRNTEIRPRAVLPLAPVAAVAAVAVVAAVVATVVRAVRAR